MKSLFALSLVRPIRPVGCLALLALAAGWWLPAAALGASATLRPSKDTTIFGPGDANLANGGGEYLFAGSSGGTGGARALRSLVAFDVASQVPAGAIVTSVSLSFTITTPLNNANTVRVHRLLADWGEGNARGAAGEGGGAVAGAGDATWNARFLNTATWTTAGGEFASAVSASQAVRGTSGTTTFAGDGLVADVQAWVNTPAANFGWILVAQDERGPAVRFASRQSPATTLRPSLTIEYTLGPVVPVAPVFSLQPASQTVAAGATVVFSATAGGTPAPAYQWQKDNVAIPGATGATLTLPGVTAAAAGVYRAVATNVAGAVTSAPATLVVNIVPEITARLSNLSVRAAMSAGQTLIVGFSVRGGSRPILVRGVGPTLVGFGVTNAMADPNLELYNTDGTRLAQNDDWANDPTLDAAFARVGAFALLPSSRDAALLQSVDGSRSVFVKGTGAGVALVELYDAGTGLSPRLINVSARNQVGTGDSILIVGFVVDGTGTKNVLIRAIGPKLVEFGVTGVLADPRLDLYRSGVPDRVAGNDNWDTTLAPTFDAVGAFALTPGSKDAALVVSLTPGAYTVQVAGADGGTGEALVEIYEAP